MIREVHEDISAVRMYFDLEDFRKLGMFSYYQSKEGKFIEEIPDEDGWSKIKLDLLKNIGDASIPSVIVSDVSNSGDLILKHAHDGRDLDLEYADIVVESIRYLWPNNVKFFTIIEEDTWEI